MTFSPYTPGRMSESVAPPDVVTRKKVQLGAYKRLKGDAGPCAKAGCHERATYKLDLWVDDCLAYTWVCDEHSKPFGTNPTA